MSSSMKSIQQQAMENQQKQIIAMSMATSRDLCYWIAGVFSLYSSILLLTPKPIYKPAFIPLGIMSIVFAYNADYAWGTKAERIRKEFYKINLQESHWFTNKQKDELIKNTL